jgi:hypothetical protein
MKASRAVRRLGAVVVFLTLFAVTASAQFIETNIAYAKRDDNNDYYPDDSVSLYTVLGRVTSPNFATNETEFYIQDTNDNVGIRVYADYLHPSLSTFTPGKELEASGYIEQTNGTRYILIEFNSDLVVNDPTEITVDPVPATISTLLAGAEDYESTFVVISNVTIDSGSWPDWMGASTLTITDSTGSLNLRIDENTDIDGQPQPTNTFHVRGIFGQYDTSTPPDGGYQILPRYYTDIEHSYGQQAPTLHIENSGTLSVAAGDAISLSLLGQDINAGDTLSITTEQSVAGATITDNGDRTADFAWTPGGGDAGTSNRIIFAVTDGVETNTAAIDIFVLSEDLANIILNEALWDPSNIGLDGDANGDGTNDFRQDEFVEIVNANTDTNIDMTGWVLRFGTNEFFTFPATVLTAETAVVIFGGGVPSGDFGNAQVFTPAETWSGFLNDPDGETINLLTGAGGSQIFSWSYDGLGAPNMSATRDPDITGDYTLHTNANPLLLQSPGLLNNGQAFPGSGITNQPPLIGAVANSSVFDGDSLLVPFNSSDPESDTITLTLSNAPASATFTDNGDGTGSLAYTGQTADVGTTFNIVLNAFDGDLSAEEPFSLTVLDSTYAGLVINEYLSDPNADGTLIHVDSNNDGVEDATQDEFVEIVNGGTNVIDVTGLMLYDASGLRHTFTSVTLTQGAHVVVFGGGSLAGFAHPPAQLASSGGLSLNNGGDTITLYTPETNEIDSVTYADSDGAASQTLYPDVTGSWTNHYLVTSFTRRASPGTKVDGSPFLTNNLPLLASIGNQSVTAGETLSFTVTVSEVDGDAVSIICSNKPTGASFTDNGDNTGDFEWITDAADTGEYSVTFHTYDKDGFDNETITITVFDSGSQAITNFWDFESGLQDWLIYSVASANDWERRSGTGAESSGYYMYCNGYNAGSASDDWLISPEIDLTTLTAPMLSFYSYKNYDGTDITVEISTNYTGSGDPSSASWTVETNWTKAGGTTWTASGDMDLSSYEGETIHIAFHYTSIGDGGGEAELWQVDQVRLTGLGGANTPVLAITNPAGASISVTNTMTSYVVQGTASTSVVGQLSWTNNLTGGNGTFAAATAWSSPAIALDVGENAITITGTNNAEASASASVSISRESPGPAGAVLYQGFEEDVNDTWNIATNPAAYNDGDVWDRVTSLSTITPTVGDQFWGMVDLTNPTHTGDSSIWHTIRFEAADISGYADVGVSFQYYTIGFDNAFGDNIRYSIMYDNGSTWEGYVDLSADTGSDWETVQISVPSTADYVRLSLEAQQNGGSDYGAWDDVRLTGTSTGFTDTDGDGMSDEYEARVFGDATSSNDWTGDLDGDGYINGEEFLADTDADNIAEFYENMITNPLAAGAVMNLLAGPPTSTNRLYDAYWTTNLLDSQGWNGIGLDVEGDPAGGAVTLTVTNDAEGRFYRTGVKLK